MTPAPSSSKTALETRPADATALKTAWIALGANLGDARQTLMAAVQAITALPATTLRAASPLYRTAPHEASGPDYLNAVVRIATPLAPEALLAALHGIEQQAGRERPYRNAPRTLDLDLLWFDSPAFTWASATLTLPHPRWRERAFVLRPLADIAPNAVPQALLDATASQPAERLPPGQQWPWLGN